MLAPIDNNMRRITEPTEKEGLGAGKMILEIQNPNTIHEFHHPQQFKNDNNFRGSLKLLLMPGDMRAGPRDEIRSGMAT
jgi:hypothetical protein